MASATSFDEAYILLRNVDLRLTDLEKIIPLLGANHPTHFGDMVVGGLELQQIPAELADLARFLVRHAPRHTLRYLEVGVGSCGTMIFLNEVLRRHGFHVDLFGVDSLLYADLEILQNQRRRIDWVRKELNGTFHIGDTAHPEFSAFLQDKSFDVIFIDSEHTYDGVMREFLLCLPHLANDGIIAFHDIASKQCPGVVAAFQKIRPYFSQVDEVICSDKCGIGLCRGLMRAPDIRDFFQLLFWDRDRSTLAPELPALHRQLAKCNEELVDRTREIDALRAQIDDQKAHLRACEARLKTAGRAPRIAKFRAGGPCEEIETTKRPRRTKLDNLVGALRKGVRFGRTSSLGGRRGALRYHIDRSRIKATGRTANRALISGWAVDVEAGKAAAVRIRIGAQVYEPGCISREDVRRHLSTICTLPVETGFDLAIEIAPGVFRLRIELQSRDGSWIRICDKLLFSPPPWMVRLFLSARRLGDYLASAPSYQRWLDSDSMRLREELPELKKHAKLMVYQPTFAIIVDAREGQGLRETVASIQHQIYERWLLHMSSSISLFSSEDYLSVDFIIFVRAGDSLNPEALYEFASTLNAFPDLDMIYADEDQMDGRGRRNSPFFKPDWSPDYLETFNYVGYPACFRRTVADRCLDAENYYDFMLRFTECTQKIHHVRKVLCHRRKDILKNNSRDDPVHMSALRGRLQRTGREGVVMRGEGPSSFYDVRIKLRTDPLVSILIPTAGKIIRYKGKDLDLIKSCVSQIHEKSSYRNFEFIIIDNGDLEPHRVGYLKEFKCRFITYSEREVNVARKLNLGSSIAQGDMLLLLNDDIQLINSDWMERLLEHFEKAHVGVVGAKLLYPNHFIQHAGVVHRSGNPEHVRRAFPRRDEGYFFSTCGVRNYAAVTGACMMTRRHVYRQVGGYTEELAISYNDVDYCRKVRDLGLTVVYAPRAELFHFESQSREPRLDPKESEYYHRHWAQQLVSDPFYNEWQLTVAPPTFRVHPNPRLI